MPGAIKNDLLSKVPFCLGYLPVSVSVFPIVEPLIRKTSLPVSVSVFPIAEPFVSKNKQPFDV